MTVLIVIIVFTVLIVVVMTFRIFSLIELSRYDFPTSDGPGRHPIPRDSATMSSPTHAPADVISSEGRGVAAKLGERGFSKLALSGDGQ